MIVATGINYVTEVFSFVGRSVSSGFSWFQSILNFIGLPWQVFSVVLIGFAVVYLLVGGVVDNFRGSADSIVSDYNQLQRRNARQAAFNRRTETMNENYKAINNTMKEVLKRTGKS